MQIQSTQERPRWLWLTALLVLLVGFRMAGPSDIDDHDQPGPIEHIMDVAVNGQWLMQHDAAGRLATKPPMYPWLGAVAIKTTGITQEWTFKLPSLLAFLAVAAVTFDLARRSFGSAAAFLAVGFWAAHHHTFKLMYTARTDMLVTLWVVLGLWSVQRLRDTWRQPHGAPAVGCIALLWLSVAAGVLTKGPPAVIPVLWLIAAIAWDGAWRTCRWRWHVGGAVAVAAVALAWLMPTLQAHPDYLATIRREILDRVTGTGADAGRSTHPLAVPGYFLARFAPWSVLFIAAAVLLWRAGRVRWAAAWVVGVCAFFALSRNVRADYLAPAYPAAAVAAAGLIVAAHRQVGIARLTVHLLLGAVALGAIIVGVAAAWGDVPQPVILKAAGHTATVGRGYPWLLGFAAAVAVTAGTLGLWWLHRRQYVPASQALAFAVVSLLCLHQVLLSDAARRRTGDHVLALVQLTRQVARNQGSPIVVYEVGKAPFQALLGDSDHDPDRRLDRARHGAVLLVSRDAWEQIAGDFHGRAHVLTVAPAGRANHSDQIDAWLMVVIDADGDGEPDDPTDHDFDDSDDAFGSARKPRQITRLYA